MNITTRLGGLLMAASVAAPVAAADDPGFISCHGCGAAQSRRAAEGAVPMTRPSGVYDIYVADAPGNRLRRYLVTAEREPGFHVNVASERTPERRYVREFKSARAEWAYVRDAAAKGIVIPRDFPVDHAEQVIGSEYNQRVISEQINRYIPARIGSLFGSALMLLRQIFTAQIVIEVDFPDGSTALFYLDRVDSLTSGHMFVYRYKPGSAVDSDGNRIPDSPASLANFQGRYTTEPNWERFKRRSQMYGADLDELLLIQPIPLPAYTICARQDTGHIYCWSH
jgi:hypothetical protein